MDGLNILFRKINPPVLEIVPTSIQYITTANWILGLVWFTQKPIGF